MGTSFSGQIHPRFDASRNRVVTDKVGLSIDASRSSGNGEPWTISELGHSPLSWGFEYVYRNLIPLRVGFNHDVTFGLGYGGADSVFSIDYSLLMTALSPQHRFSFSYFFTDPPPQPSASPELREYRIVKSDALRFRDRFIAEGKKSLRDLKYDLAVTAFEKAWVLDPLDNDVQSYLDRAHEAQERVLVHQHVSDIKKVATGDDYKGDDEGDCGLVHRDAQEH